jgi:hypothetical protein
VKSFRFELRVRDPLARKSHQFGPIELKRKTELDADRAVLVVVHLRVETSAVLEVQSAQRLHHRRALESHILGRRMPKRGIAAALRAIATAAVGEQAPELLHVDLFADVVQEQNLKRTGERRTGHRVPIITASGWSSSRRTGDHNAVSYGNRRAKRA